jgi:hypothetical protein
MAMAAQSATVQPHLDMLATVGAVVCPVVDDDGRRRGLSFDRAFLVGHHHHLATVIRPPGNRYGMGLPGLVLGGFHKVTSLLSRHPRRDRIEWA